MSRRILGAVAVIAGLAAAAQPAAAQGFEVGYTDIGPTIGLGGLGSASMAIGGRFERGFKALPDLGNGILGIMVGADYYSFNYNYFGGNSSSITYIPIGATANYHFKLANSPKIDPFLGLGLGYEVVSAKCEYQGVNYCSGVYSSALYFIGRAGGRYFVNNKLAVYADAGAGAATLSVGATFRLQ
jgi:hypothetical protein